LKIYITILLILISNLIHSQCLDVYNRSSSCPTENDSLVVYNNALKVYEFYEKNPDYIKLKSIRLKTRQEVLNCFYQLENAVDSFIVLRQLRDRVINGENLPNVLLPRDGKNIPMNEYYIYIDDYRFYQRELENGILNVNSPFPIYDIRIAPLIINSYENRFSYDEYNGDFVNVTLYIPVTVKPYKLLTDSEKIIRNEILKGSIPKKILQPKTKPKPKLKSKPTKPSPKDDSPLESANIDYVPPIIRKEYKYTVPPPGSIGIYYLTPYGGGYLMGFIVGRKFRKYLPTDEFYWAMPKWLKDFLDNDVELEKYLKNKLGSYYNGLYK
jgi:hypothetical protein